MKKLALILSLFAIYANAQVGIVDAPTHKSVSDGGGSVPTATYQWKLNGDLIDNIGGNNGTAFNSPSYVTGQDGTANHAIAFDGTSQYATFTPTTVVSTFTISVWVKTSGGGGDFQGILANLSPLNGLLLHDSGGVVEYYDGSVENSIATLTSGVWHNVVVSCNSLACTAYIDGASAGTFTIASSQSFDRIGAYNGGGNWFYFSGDEDDVRIWSGVALNATQVSSVYTQGAQ